MISEGQWAVYNPVIVASHPSASALPLVRTLRPAHSHIPVITHKSPGDWRYRMHSSSSLQLCQLGTLPFDHQTHVVSHIPSVMCVFFRLLVVLQLIGQFWLTATYTQTIISLHCQKMVFSVLLRFRYCLFFLRQLWLYYFPGKNCFNNEQSC